MTSEETFDPSRVTEERATWEETTEALQDCRRYLTDFGSVEPSALVRRIDSALANLRRRKDERCYLWQLEGVNEARVREGKPPLTYTQFMTGTSQAEPQEGLDPRSLARRGAAAPKLDEGVIAEALKGCVGIESGPNGSGGMRVVVHFAEAPQEQPLFSLLTLIEGGESLSGKGR